MSAEDQTAQALEAFGYTARQAQFLALAAVHGGYFLRRQFLAFHRACAWPRRGAVLGTRRDTW